jgi:predicted enzyme related to lactoylglutathione lyase
MTHHTRPGDPIWADLFTSDPDRSVAFYTELFGWTAERAGEEFGNYITFRKDGKVVAGGMANHGDGGPDQWTVYLASSDAKRTADAATKNGGAVVVGPTPVGDLGTFAILGDVAGVGVGVWQPAAMAGFETRGTVGGGAWTDHAGAPSWFELHTSRYDDSLRFYRDVFGWEDPVTVSDTPEFRYTTLHSETPMLGGVMDSTQFLPDGVPGYWTVYFGSDDVDATVAKLVELGGSVIRPAEDTPYGRLAAVADPGGVRFSIGGNAKS